MIEMDLGHYMIIWIANGAIPLGVTLFFMIDHVIQWFVKWRNEGVI